MPDELWRVHGNAGDLATSRHLLLCVRSMSPQVLQVCRILTLPQAGGLFITLFTEFPKYVYSVDSIPTALTPSVWSWDAHTCCHLMEPRAKEKQAPVLLPLCPVLEAAEQPKHRGCPSCHGNASHPHILPTRIPSPAVLRAWSPAQQH